MLVDFVGSGDCWVVWEFYFVQFIFVIFEFDCFVGDWVIFVSWYDGCQCIYFERENAQHLGCRGIDVFEWFGDVF